MCFFFFRLFRRCVRFFSCLTSEGKWKRSRWLEIQAFTGMEAVCCRLEIVVCGNWGLEWWLSFIPPPQFALDFGKVLISDAAKLLKTKVPKGLSVWFQIYIVLFLIPEHFSSTELQLCKDRSNGNGEEQSCERLKGYNSEKNKQMTNMEKKCKLIKNAKKGNEINSDKNNSKKGRYSCSSRKTGSDLTDSAKLLDYS